MTRGFSRYYGAFFSKISGVIPFSLTELSFVLLVAGIIALLVFAIIGLVKKKYVASINRAIEIAALIFLSLDFYNLSCEFSYNRKELPLPYFQERVMRTEHLPIFNYYADDINACISSLEFEESGEVKSNMSLNELTEEIKKSYQILADNDYFYNHFRLISIF